MLSPITVERSFNALKVRFGDVTHLRIDATKLIGHQSWREGYGNCKFVIEYTTTGGHIVCEYDTEDKWKQILAGLDKALDQPNRGPLHGLNREAAAQHPVSDNPHDPFASPDRKTL